MPIIKSVDDLPDWFRLSDYDICDTFTEKEWETQLNTRKQEHLLACASQFVKANSDIFNVDNVIAQITGNCIRTPSDDYRLAVEEASTHFSQEDGGMNFYGCVRPVIFGEIAPIFERHQDELIDWNLRAFDEAVPMKGKATLEVDLSARDSVLVEQFQEVVNKYRKLRKQANPKKKASDASIQKLRQYKVLAYLDLTHWAALSGTQIHSAVLAKALFPSSERGERFINGTLKVWAERAMQPGFINTLYKL